VLVDCDTVVLNLVVFFEIIAYNTEDMSGTMTKLDHPDQRTAAAVGAV